MIKVENIKVYNIARAIYSARNAYGSWNKSDSDLENDIVGKNDLELARKLFKAGESHRKFLRQCFVVMDVTAPMYFLKQLDTFKIGTVSNSSSTMHCIHKKPFELDDFSHEHMTEGNIQGFGLILNCLNTARQNYLETKDKLWWWQMIQTLPSSYNQRRTITMNYENVVNIIHQRAGHKLDEWNYLIDELKKLPYIKEIMDDD